MVTLRRLYVTAITLGVVALACLVVAFLRRHHVEDAFPGIEGAYFNRSAGEPAFAGSFSGLSGNVLDPFRIGNAYLWLGAAAGFAIAAVSVALVARLSPRSSSPTAASPAA